MTLARAWAIMAREVTPSKPHARGGCPLAGGDGGPGAGAGRAVRGGFGAGEHAAAAGYDLTKDPLIRLKREEVLVENRLVAWQDARMESGM